MARYLGVSAGKWKYWEIHVEGGVVTLDEGALGTLGKRTVHTFPNEAAARKDAAAREKKVLARGYTLQPEPTNLAAGLFAAFAPYSVEAQRGDPARAAAKALAVLQARHLSELLDVGYCALTLARRGALDEARQVIDAFDAQRDELREEGRAGHRALAAATQILLGRSESFDALADEALATMPTWGAARTWPHTYQREGVALAAALLDHGRREDARALFGALGHFGLDALLARGALEWSDAIAPDALTDPWKRDHYRLARATVVGNEAFAQTFAAMVDEDLGAMSLDEARCRLHLLALALQNARDQSLAAAQAGLLRRAIHQFNGAHPRSERVHPLWFAVAQLARMGHDVSPELVWASSPLELVRAATALQQQAPGAAVMPRVVEMLRALPTASAPRDVGWAVEAVLVRARLGEVIAPPQLRDLAARAGPEFLAHGDLAAVALAQGDRALGWEILELATSRELRLVAYATRRRLASWGMLGAYKTLSDAIPPTARHDQEEESPLIADVLDGA